MAGDQITLNDVEMSQKQAKVRALAQELDRRLKYVANSIERKHFAAICDKTYGYMGNVLNTNNPEAAKPFQVDFIPAEIIESPDLFMKEIWNPVAEWCSYKPSAGKQSKLTPEQELEAIKNKIHEHGLEKIFDL